MVLAIAGVIEAQRRQYGQLEPVQARIEDHQLGHSRASGWLVPSASEPSMIIAWILKLTSWATMTM